MDSNIDTNTTCIPSGTDKDQVLCRSGIRKKCKDLNVCFPLLQYLNLDVSASNDRACAILKSVPFFETTETYRKLIIVAKFKSASYFLPIGLRSIN